MFHSPDDRSEYNYFTENKFSPNRDRFSPVEAHPQELVRNRKGHIEEQMEPVEYETILNQNMASNTYKNSPSTSQRHNIVAAQQQKLQEEARYGEMIKQIIEQKSKELAIGGKEKVLIELAEMRMNIEWYKKQNILKDEFTRQVETERNKLLGEKEYLLEENSRLQHSLSQVSGEFQKTKTERSAIDSALKELEKEKKSVYDYCQTMIETKAALQNEIQELKQTIKRVSSERDSIQNSFEATKHQLEHTTKSFEDTSRDLDQLRKGDMTLKQQYDRLKVKLDEKTNQFSELSAVQDELLNAIRDAKTEVADLQHEKQVLTQDYHRTFKENERKEMLIATLQNEMRRMEQQFTEKCNSLANTLETREKEHADEFVRMQNQVSSLTNSKLQLETEIEDMKREVTKYQQITSELNNTASKNPGLLAQIGRLESQVKDLTQALSQEKAKSGQVSQDFAKLSKQLESNNEKIVEKDDYIDKLKQQILSLEENLSSTTSNWSSTEDLVKQLKQEQTVARKVLQEEIYDLRTERDELSRANIQLTEKLNVVSQENQILNDQIVNDKTRFEAEIDKLKSAVNELSSTLKSLSKEKSSLESQVQNLTEQLHQQISQNRQHQNTISEFTSKCQILEDTVEALNRSMSERDSAIIDLGSKLRIATTKYEEVHEVHEAYKSQSEMETKSLLSMIKGLKNEIAAKKKQIETLEGEHSTKINESENEKNARRVLENQMKQLQQQIESITQALNEQKESYKRLEERYKKNMELAAALEKKYVKVETDRAMEKRVSHGEIAHLRSLNQKLQKSVALLEQEANRARNSITLSPSRTNSLNMSGMSDN